MSPGAGPYAFEVLATATAVREVLQHVGSALTVHLLGLQSGAAPAAAAPL